MYSLIFLRESWLNGWYNKQNFEWLNYPFDIVLASRLIEWPTKSFTTTSQASKPVPSSYSHVQPSNVQTQDSYSFSLMTLIITWKITYCAVWWSILLNNDCSSVLDIGPELWLSTSSLKMKPSHRLRITWMFQLFIVN